LLGRVREVCLQAHAHQELPFEKLVEELQPVRSLSYSPLFQVALALQNMAPAASGGPAALQQQLVEVGHHTAKFDLSLSLSGDAGGITGGLEHNTDLFDASTISRLIDQLTTLLLGAVREPGRAVGDLPLLSAGQMQQLLVERNDTATSCPWQE